MADYAATAGTVNDLGIPRRCDLDQEAVDLSVFPDSPVCGELKAVKISPV